MTTLPRGACPGCGREVPLLRPVTVNSNRPALPWRRKAHAVTGDLGQPGTSRCRYPTTLAECEIPEEP